MTRGAGEHAVVGLLALARDRACEAELAAASRKTALEGILASAKRRKYEEDTRQRRALPSASSVCHEVVANPG
jgi:hypothetical protein